MKKICVVEVFRANVLNLEHKQMRYYCPGGWGLLNLKHGDKKYQE